MIDDFTKEFIYFFTHNTSLSHDQIVKRDKLLYRDLMSEKKERKAVKKSKDFKLLTPLRTKELFSLFNNPDGLKYLTHPFYDDQISLVELAKNCQEQLKSFKGEIPLSLYSLIDAYLMGKQNWLDTYGNKHKSTISDDVWNAWSEDNNLHPIENEEFKKEIQAFRHTVRLADAQLGVIVNKLKVKYPNLNISTKKLDAASFYTNTYTLNTVLSKILRQMSNRAENSPNVSIEYKQLKKGEFFIVQVIITQKDSYPDNELDPLIMRLKKDPFAGDFGAIRNILNGYCYWSVVTRWGDKFLKWNILPESDAAETEVVDADCVSGFTHVLTYYIV